MRPAGLIASREDPVMPPTGPAALGPAPAPACGACPHERDAHDPHGTRFCAATTAAVLDRGCICVGEARRAVAR